MKSNKYSVHGKTVTRFRLKIISQSQNTFLYEDALTEDRMTTDPCPPVVQLQTLQLLKLRLVAGVVLVGSSPIDDDVAGRRFRQAQHQVGGAGSERRYAFPSFDEPLIFFRNTTWFGEHARR